MCISSIVQLIPQVNGLTEDFSTADDKGFVGARFFRLFVVLHRWNVLPSLRKQYKQVLL